MSISTSDSNMTPEKTQAPIRYPSDLIDEEWEILQPIFDELEFEVISSQQSEITRQGLDNFRVDFLSVE